MRCTSLRGLVTVIISFLRRWLTARLEHLLQQLVSHATDTVALRYCDERKHVVVADVGRESIAVLVRKPLELRGLRAARAHEAVLHVVPGLVDRLSVRSHLVKIKYRVIRWKTPIGGQY